ncbi:hypothetical protein HPC49_13165 [Pyxidicoccus fallax]|uniref:Uncharacterized protein n=1 Tax=Pyxidicoccus fallax TaxID=394095 RepID=A0A848LDP6_9BACT|nr:hypothetical protein [Pyxidicoccus fallax]NMO17210.1 hypothetical protein [Pyxidicoccus fallax]NPC79184.1 hypothetical protein [Pyxidicoccus fallax]
MSATAVASSEEHELALLLNGRCRACAERIPGGTALRGLPCPRCGEATLPSPTDREVLHQLATERASVRLWLAVAAVAVAGFAASWFPLLTSVLLIVALVWIRVTIVRPALQFLTPRRRMVSRLTLRLAAGCFVAAAILLHELLTFVPAFGALAKVVLSASQVAAAGIFARRYLAWQTEREARGLPMEPWEVTLLVVFLLLLLGLTTAAGMLLWWVFQQLGVLNTFLAGPAVGG